MEITGTYEESESLIRHQDHVAKAISNLVLKDASNEKFITFVTQNQTELSSYFYANEQGEAVRLPLDKQDFLDEKVSGFLQMIMNLDYISQWLIIAEKHLNIVAGKTPLIDIEWGLQETVQIYSIFNFYCKTIFLLSHSDEKISFLWKCFKLTKHCKNVKLSSSIDFIDNLLDSIGAKATDFLSEHMNFMKIQMTQFLSLIIPVFIQVFGPYGSFDWGICSYDRKEDEKRGSSLPYKEILILQNFSLFRETILFYASIFPNTFNSSIQYKNLLGLILSDCSNLILCPSLTIEFISLLDVFSNSSSSNTLERNLKSIESKPADFQRKRIQLLCSLFDDYIDHIETDDTTLMYFYDKIFAILGFSFYQLMAAKEDNLTSLDLLSSVLQMKKLFENQKVKMQRVFLFNLVTLDIPYMYDLLFLFQSSVNQLPQQDIIIISPIQTICNSLELLDLQKFDEGIRWDFKPLLLTYGRIILYVFMNRTKFDFLTQTTFVLNHLYAIKRHVDLCNSPISFFVEIFPLHKLFENCNDLVKLFESAKLDLSNFRYLFDVFSFYPLNKGNEQAFSYLCDLYVKKISSGIINLIAPSSSFIKILKQGTFNPDFNSNTYIPSQNSFSKLGYIGAAQNTTKFCNLLDAIYNLPKIIEYGSFKYQFKERFLTFFFIEANEQMVNKSNDPSKIQSLLTAFHTFLPIFRVIGISYSLFVKNFVVFASQLNFNGSLFKQYQVFSGDLMLTEQSIFLDNYIKEIESFIQGEYKNYSYEPLARKFSKNKECSTNFEQLIGLQPMIGLIRLFGVSASIQIDSFLIKTAIQKITNLLNLFKNEQTKLANLEFNFYSKGIIDCAEIQSEGFKEASETVVLLGLVIAIRNILSNS